MEGLTLSTTTTSTTSSAIHFFSQPILHPKKSAILTFPCRKSRNLSVFASRDEANLDEWDKMELKFGKMLGEDPKMTLAKIMGRKLNPDLSYLEIEKLLDKKKGKALNEGIEEVPFDVSGEKNLTKSIQGLNLARPMPKKGTKFEATGKAVGAEAKRSNRQVRKTTAEIKSSVPDVILRKPNSFYADNGGNEQSSLLKMKPNLTLKMGKGPPKGRFSDITLLKKPEVMSLDPESREESGPFNSSEGKVVLKNGNEDNRPASAVRNSAATLLQKPELLDSNKEGEQEPSDELVGSSSSSDSTKNNLDNYHPDNQLETASGSNLNQFSETRQTDSEQDKGYATELQAIMQSGGQPLGSDGPSGSTSLPTTETVLIEKPKRFDLSGRAIDQKDQEEVKPTSPVSLGNSLELENFLSSSPIKEREDIDWARAEKLANTGEREEVELISSSTKGFAASFGSLIGFLPYRNLTSKWKFLAFESWLRRKGLDPSIYRQNLGVVGNEVISSINTSDSSIELETGSKEDGTIPSDMKLEDLLLIYDQEKLKFLSSFVGQRTKVGVVLADRKSRKLIFSIKPKEKEEMVEKKRNLMAQLRVGDVIKCCIKKITYFGVFVEVEGVPALIHQTEVSWDATLDPASYFKVGQIVEAKVHQLDFSLQRIFLSLKEVTPDPLLGALEAVVGDHGSLVGQLEAAELDTEWPDVESLIKELQQVAGIQSVLKGQYFLSPGLAPTFQVYMASMFEHEYKLLARAGNRVQEVIVQTSLSKEQLKSAIMACTNRVE